MKIFNSYRDSVYIKDHVKSKHIIAGEYSYYSGYYHGVVFDECVMYLDVENNNCDADEIDKLIIGKFCSIATGVKFMMGGTQWHNYNWIASYPLDSFDEDFDNYETVPPKAYKLKGDTVLGNDVWIGTESLIMSGIKIADGAIVGARSLVTKNIGAYEIWGGNPARLIKKRFSDEDIEKLLQIKWWDWSDDKIKQNLHLLRDSDVESLWESGKKYL
ncbi:acetyltransferase [Rickettsia bellii]|uniref:Chloramphenicol acetyltransferase n=1 Tax=Rickettsia bellii str. RML An4 TaxID=1359193 RepID=A0A0F3QAS0_RICBE|nr:CatB-related O-acetyltransferase [Rickettsia bellii]ARD86911.1 acetyltransferase [Rickettsia bellii]KJV89342.1 chloramphenicol acetyltransferase [Rickettsia bellii str. RML An4]